MPRSVSYEGRFGRLFRRLDPAPKLDEEVMDQLVEQMREPADAPGSGGWGGPQAPPTDLDNPSIPAVYTYFGQFVDHDITFDPVSQLDAENDPNALHNFRTPRFDLDSVYGSGPADEPFQYDGDADRLKLLIGENAHGDLDLPRNVQGIALLGDPRNDENIIVSQLQLVFLRFHNKVVDHVSADQSVPSERKFEEAQRLTRWHYQWVVVHDFLRRLVGDLLNELFRIEDGEARFSLKFFRPKQSPYMPVEFSAAAFRFGHSQIRPAYDLSERVRARPIFIPGEDVGEFDDLRGFRHLPQDWSIDWRLFVGLDGSTPQPSRKIDSKLASGLFDLPRLPEERSSLARRNLERGEALALPSGQSVARAVGAEPVFTGSELGAPEPTPLWFYVLKESELTGDPPGTRLGPVGARIVAEVLLGLLRHDPRSWVNANPGWTPTLPPGDASFQLADLIGFATD